MSKVELYCSCGARFRCICSGETAERITTNWQTQHTGPAHQVVTAEEFDRIYRMRQKEKVSYEGH